MSVAAARPACTVAILAAELSDAQMQEYFRLVNLSIRKVYREIALRESGDRKRNEPRTSGGWLE